MKTSLYRHFDKDGNLLYIGISLSSLNRLGQHADHSAWYKSIVNVTIEHFETRQEALDAETKAIVKEKPLHNLQKLKEKDLRNKIKTGMRQSREEIIQDAKNEIVSRIVKFKPIYSISEIRNFLNINEATFKKLINDGVLGHIVIPAKLGLSAHGTPYKEKIAVTGWQLIDYIEYLEQKSVT